jgi:hypothetical protein
LPRIGAGLVKDEISDCSPAAKISSQSAASQRHLQTVVNPLDGLSLTDTQNISRSFKRKKQE